MTLPQRLRTRLTALARRMRRDRIKGSTAIEFAAVAPVFFLLLMGIVETGTIYFAQVSLQDAVNDAARQIRTGNAANMADTSQTSNYSNVARCDGSGTGYADAKTWFAAQVCCGLSSVLKCSDVTVDVNTAANGFSGATFSDAATANNYNTGNACDVVMVRAIYNWSVVTPYLYMLLAGNNMGGNHQIVASSAFRNEPYSSGASGC